MSIDMKVVFFSVIQPQRIYKVIKQWDHFTLSELLNNVVVLLCMEAYRRKLC